MNAFRMVHWLVLTLVLITLAYFVQDQFPGSLIAVTLYKAHLLALGGWAGYWLDRALFPYDRPHEYLDSDAADKRPVVFKRVRSDEVTGIVPRETFAYSMLRRAILVAACVVAVCLGA